METRSNHVLVGAVTLLLLLVLAIFIVWISRLSDGNERQYDIFFSQAVDGIAPGSAVAFSGVPAGQVKEIAFWPPDPRLVRVRIKVNSDVPILEGTTASVEGVGFTGVSQIQLDGAIKGAPAITCPQEDPQSACPLGVPVIPTKTSGFGAILNSAPQLLERLTTLTERLTELLGDKNQASIAGILENTNRLTAALADRGPEMAATIAEMRTAVAQIGTAAEEIGALADSTKQVMDGSVDPAMQNLNEAVIAAKQSMANLDSAISDARPGLQTFSQQTMPQATQLVQDLRRTAVALGAIAERLDREGAGSLISPPKLPDYEPQD
ncbi:MlaD family protein [Stakelama tenebrarum]|uniref:MCE family protein n=1 Tax=Stakelama tenebrarum TaxID=2711215 RepID=A0A6G6Y227_9SPHN|nr:MlaD family protein [Sphingosinithalassobacter tenebrarum]QIG78891.1 MCE family protein [Sphingosinithalassobacter tenebrarum]